MGEPASSFQMTLGATEQELRLLFAMPEDAETEEGYDQQQNQRAVQEVHVRTGFKGCPPNQSYGNQRRGNSILTHSITYRIKSYSIV